MILLKMELGENLLLFGWGIIALVAVFGAHMALEDIYYHFKHRP